MGSPVPFLLKRGCVKRGELTLVKVYEYPAGRQEKRSSVASGGRLGLALTRSQIYPDLG